MAATATTLGNFPSGTPSICRAVNQPSKSVVPEIGTLRSVGAGGG
jgi:hypothetical protein